MEKNLSDFLSNIQWNLAITFDWQHCNQPTKVTLKCIEQTPIITNTLSHSLGSLLYQGSLKVTNFEGEESLWD